MTGLEVPGGAKVMREDPYKKRISADPVSVRQRFTILTEQVQLRVVEKVRNERHAQVPWNDQNWRQSSCVGKNYFGDFQAETMKLLECSRQIQA